MSEEFDNQEGSQGQKEQDQQEQAVNTQDNAGIPPSVISTNKPRAATAIKTQTGSGNVPLTQDQKDAAAQATVTQNIEGDRKAHEYNDNLVTLKRIVGKAWPVVEERQETEEQKDANGNTVQVPVTKKVTTGYQYYAVNGKPFTQWVDETFNGQISIDEENNKINYNGDPSNPFDNNNEGEQQQG